MVYCENHEENVSRMSGENYQHLVLKLAVYILTTGL